MSKTSEPDLKALIERESEFTDAIRNLAHLYAAREHAPEVTNLHLVRAEREVLGGRRKRRLQVALQFFWTTAGGSLVLLPVASTAMDGITEVAGASPFPFWAKVVIALALAGSFAYGYVTSSQNAATHRSAASIAAEAARLDAEAAATETPESGNLQSFLETQLSDVVARSRESMVLADGRADRLFRIGVTLIVCALFAPAVSAVLYYSAEQISPSTLDALRAVAERTDGALPEGITMSLGRDWRVLIAGASFGFLFLAAAQAMLSQHRRQSEIYSQLESTVAMYENALTAYRIKFRVGESGVDVITLVLGALLSVGPRESPSSGVTSSVELSHIEALKKILESGSA